MIEKFKAFLIIILLFSFPNTKRLAAEVSTQTSSTNSSTTTPVIVGFLKTETALYPEEKTFSDNIADMLLKLGGSVVMIDYNKIVEFDKVKDQAILKANGKQDLVEKIESDKIKEIVFKFITDNKINRIFIPGNYYNLDHEPYPPTPNRQLITKALVEIVKDNPKIHIMGVCGGLQGIMHSLGVEIIRVQEILKTQEGIESHIVSMPDPHQENVHLHKMRVVPRSRLASIVSQYVSPDESGWFSLFFPDAHGGVVNNTEQNIRLLESLGYKITGFSEDGIIEVIEDQHGNIYFQDHPESLVINALKKSPELNNNFNKEKNYSTLAAIAIFNDFLYRKD